MSTIEFELNRGKLGMTIYSPDTYYANIASDIDEFIKKKTGLIPVYRYEFRHSSKTIEKFYEPVVYKNIPHWHLVSKLFTTGPCLLTFWIGNNAINQLTGIKGKSHPKYADKDTVRGKFLCDNAICNLIHTSDNKDEMIRELFALGFYSLLKQTFIHSEMKYVFKFSNNKEPVNNGTYIFYNFITRISKYGNISIQALYRENSESFYYKLINEIKKIDLNNCMKIRMLVTAFLNGDMILHELLENYKNLLSDRERFIIDCTVSSQHIWNNKQNYIITIRNLFTDLNNISGLILGGSAAMKIYGYQCSPSDIDIICTNEAIERISTHLKLPINIKDTTYGNYRYILYEYQNWNIEFSTMANYNSGYNLVVDDEMLKRAGDTIPLMPLEDIIVELCSLGRTDYHADLDRANSLFTQFQNFIDKSYLIYRFRKSGIEKDNWINQIRGTLDE